MRGAFVLALGLALAHIATAKLVSISPTPQLPEDELPLVPAPAPRKGPTAAHGVEAVMEAPVEIHHLPKKAPVSIEHVKSPVSIEHVHKPKTPVSIEHVKSPVVISPVGNGPSTPNALAPSSPNALAPSAVGEEAGPGDEPAAPGCPYTKSEMTDVFGALYYHEGPASDNSFGSWSTDFAWAAGLYIAAMWLKSQSRDQHGLTLFWRPGYEHTRWLLTWALLFLSLSEMFAGWYHLIFTNYRVHREDTVWILCLLCLATHASLYTCGCIAMHRQGDSTWLNLVGYLVSFASGFVMFSLAFVFDWDFPVAFSIMSLVPLVLVTFSIGLHGIKYKTWKDTAPVLVGCGLNLFALSINWSTSDECAIRCPVDCPFPVPNFNHNAVYHLLSLVSVYPTVVGLAGMCHELESPDGMPYFGLYARERSLKPNYKRPHARRDQLDGRFAQDADHEGNYRDDCLPSLNPPGAEEVSRQVGHVKKAMHGPEEVVDYEPQHDYVHRHDYRPDYYDGYR